MKKSNFFKSALCLGVVVSLMGTMKTAGVSQASQANLALAISNPSPAAGSARSFAYVGGYYGALIGASGSPIDPFLGSASLMYAF